VTWQVEEQNRYVFGFRLPRDSIKALGIFFLYDENKTNELNFVEKIRNLKRP